MIAKRRQTWRSTCATATLVSGLFAGACQKHEPPPDPTELPAVEVASRTVRSQSHQASEEVVGTVRAKVRAVVEAKVSGRIKRMPVSLGQPVRAGQLLATLDVVEIGAQLSQARARLEQAESNLRRYEQLLAQQAVTQQEYDAAKAHQRVARAAVQQARTMLGYATIKAPFAGVVTRKHLDVGDLAAPGKPLLEIEDPRALRLEVGLPEALIDRVAVGKAVPVRLAGIDGELAGKVTEVAPSADPNSRTFVVKIELPAHEEVRIGQFGRAVVPTAQTTIVRVPRSAVVRRGQLEIVFVVHKGRARLRLVKTGKRFADEVEIVSGLEEGEAVVVDNAERLLDGQPVDVRQSDSASTSREAPAAAPSRGNPSERAR